MARASFALCSKCRFRAWAWHARRSRYALNAGLEHGRGTRGVRAYALNSDLEHGRGLPVVYSRETAAAITIVANSTTYDAKVARLTCFVDKQGKATIRHAAAYEPEPRKVLVTSWEQA